MCCVRVFVTFSKKVVFYFGTTSPSDLFALAAVLLQQNSTAARCGPMHIALECPLLQCRLIVTLWGERLLSVEQANHDTASLVVVCLGF